MNQWIQAEDSAIDASDLDPASNRKERLRAVSELKNKAHTQKRAFAIHIDEKLLGHELFTVIEKIISITQSLGIKISINATPEEADLILAAEGTPFKDLQKTILFSLSNESVFATQVALFRSVFIRLLNRSINKEGDMHVDLRAFNLLEWKDGFMIREEIVKAFDSDIIKHLQRRIVKIAA